MAIEKNNTLRNWLILIDVTHATVKAMQNAMLNYAECRVILPEQYLFAHPLLLVCR